MKERMTTEGESLLRDLTPQVLAAVMRRFGDFGAAEDAVQEALLTASLQWPRQGIPDNPRRWLIHVAGRRMQDHIRSELARRRREQTALQQIPSDQWAVPDAATDATSESDDDALTLLFMCCHPALSSTSAVALTLRAVGGLTTAQIASAYMVPESTMAQRISRAKQRIKGSHIPFQMPSEAERPKRLNEVLHVLYLIFNEGYGSSTGESFQRPDLAAEAIRLTRHVHGILPDHPEVTGLLALMLLTDARREARTGSRGELVPLAEQNRRLWDRQAIAEGTELLTVALSKGSVGPYQLQAAVAALHDEAETADATDWAQIFALYGLLRRMSDNPMVIVNQAVAAAMVYGAQAGLNMLESLDADKRIAEHHRLAAVRAHLYERMGDVSASIHHYRMAAERTRSLQERDYLLAQVIRLSDALGSRQVEGS